MPLVLGRVCQQPPSKFSCALLFVCCIVDDIVCAVAKADSTLRSSQAVPHPSTNRALRRLTSEVRRDPVHSTRYGRQRTCCLQSALLLGGPSYHASKVPWSLDAVTCCVAVCYHKQVHGCLADVTPSARILLGSSLPAGPPGLLFLAVHRRCCLTRKLTRTVNCRCGPPGLMGVDVNLPG